MSDEPPVVINHLDVDIPDEEYQPSPIPEPRPHEHNSVNILNELKRQRRAVRELQSVAEQEIKNRHKVCFDISEEVRKANEGHEEFAKVVGDSLEDTASLKMAVFGNEKQKFKGLVDNAVDTKGHIKAFAIKLQSLGAKVKYMYIAGACGITGIFGTLAFILKIILDLKPVS